MAIHEYHKRTNEPESPHKVVPHKKIRYPMGVSKGVSLRVSKRAE